MTTSPGLTASFDEPTGSLFIRELDLALTRHLTEETFLAVTRQYLYADAGTRDADEFFLVPPVQVWGRKFMLSVSFRAHTSPRCTAYSLEPHELTALLDGGASKASTHRQALIDFLRGQLMATVQMHELSGRALWRYAWGLVSVGSVTQNSFRQTASIGWFA